MKIVHLCLGCFYPDNYSYQENMLPKFHKELGYDVEVIASTQSFDENGKTVFLDKTGSYFNEYGIKVTRLPYKNNNKIGHKLKRYIGTYSAVESATPDILFIHGAQFTDIVKVVKYLKTHCDVKVYVDNHADFSNSATNSVSKVIHKTLWRYCEHQINPFTTKFYGVLPARVDFLTDVYKLPAEKCELLVMGADDELVNTANSPEVKKEIREKYGVAEDDFLIVTGGKINGYRAETLDLMSAVADINNPKIKLLVFGNVSEELKDKFNQLSDGERIIYAGWQSVRDTYNFLACADLVVFPGLHSVMWEQAVALGVPCLFRDLNGFHHIDIGGNAVFLKDVSKQSLKTKIEELINDPQKISKMKNIAQEKGKTFFSYKEIAQKSIEL